MRKYILFVIFLLLIPFYLYATDGVSTVEHPAKVNSVATPDKVNTVSGLAAAGGCTSCTGGLLFAAYFEENENLNITEGTPCGCAAGGGDVTWTAADSCVIVEGANGYVDSADGDKLVSFTVSSDDIVDDAAGSVAMKIKCNTIASGGRFFEVYYNGSNFFYFYFYQTDDIYFMYEGNNVEVYAGFTNQVADGNVYYILARWTTSDVNPNLYFAAYNSSKELIDEDTTDTNLTALTATPTVLKIGNEAAIDSDTHIYGVKIYDSYAGATTADFTDLD